ncbi:hypothetical protein HPT25_14310 [Bacillus sp. BRMEA1]|uniref:hypothetical protein n=1 Tax=Neobacillus endophyticus TaxID=2738405 RepID=UPI0015642015|nr:hypothetical protein [Neobacillus endophyticus]NRD78535.1 hypothetical protein [Neobacillus endophyticus]
MDGLFKIHIFLVAATIGLTLELPLELFLFHTKLTPISAVCLPISWIVMLKTNPAWKILWEKWTKNK